MADQEPKTQAGQGAAAPDEEQEHLGGERFNRRLLVIAGVFAVVVGVIAGEGIRSAGVKTTSAGTQPPTDNTVDDERHKAEVAELGGYHNADGDADAGSNCGHTDGEVANPAGE